MKGGQVKEDALSGRYITVYGLDAAGSSTVATSVCVKEVWVGRLAKRLVLLWGGGAVGGPGQRRKSEGKGRTSEREEVRLVRAQTWAKVAGGDALFSIALSHLHLHVGERGSKDKDRGVQEG